MVLSPIQAIGWTVCKWATTTGAVGNARGTYVMDLALVFRYLHLLRQHPYFCTEEVVDGRGNQ